MELKVERSLANNWWLVQGDGVNAVVFGSVKYGPNGAIRGKGALKYHKEVIAAVEKFREDLKRVDKE